MTALVLFPEDDDPDTILREAEAVSAVDVDTMVWMSMVAEPVTSLEKMWGAVVPELAGIGA